MHRLPEPVPASVLWRTLLDGEAQGTTLKNPVTGEDHLVAIDLNQGFIWKRGECGQGTFEVEAEGVHMAFQDSNWILYDFDWTNQT